MASFPELTGIRIQSYLKQLRAGDLIHPSGPTNPRAGFQGLSRRPRERTGHAFAPALAPRPRQARCRSQVGAGERRRKSASFRFCAFALWSLERIFLKYASKRDPSPWTSPTTPRLFPRGDDDARPRPRLAVPISISPAIPTT